MRRILILLWMVLCVILTGCGVRETESQKSPIVFVYQKASNGYYGVENRGFFIDREGNLCRFDLAVWGEQYLPIENLYEHLLNTIEDYVQKPYLTSEEVEEWYGYLEAIDTEREMYKGVVSDGDTRYYGIRSDDEVEFVLLETTDAWVRRTRDENGLKLLELLKETVKENGY